MYTKQPKKMLIINILDILNKYTDANHRLSQKDIVEILERDYEMVVDRKAVKRNLMNLLDFGYDIEYTEKVRYGKNGEEESVLTDWYIERDFSDAELRLMIDSLLFSKNIPVSQCKELIGKIEGLSNKYFRSKVRHVQNLAEDRPQNPEMFYIIEILDEAIEKGRKVEFNYTDYGIDKKRHFRVDTAGKRRKYLINPYQMVATNGKYYLICNVDKYEEVSHFRIDRIKNIKLLDEPVKPHRQVKGIENGLNLPKHMAEHIYMFAGESKVITLRASKWMAGEFVDWFGNGVTFKETTNDEIIATVTANEMAIKCWVMQYMPNVRVISPQSLVDSVKSDLKSALSAYDNK